MKKITVGLVQMCSTEDRGYNIETVTRLIRQAHRQGARFVLTPEMTDLFESQRHKLMMLAQTEAQDPCLKALRALAHELDIWILLGSLPIKIAKTKLTNCSYLLSPSGQVVARYAKIHLFDVELGSDHIYQESATFSSGNRIAVTRTSFGKIGLSICYDLRFPYLYRTQARKGATFLCVPSAFTMATGKAHWEILLRARAIENGAFVLAPAQVGRHPNGRQTYGHSLVVSPWGRVLANARGKSNTTLIATLNLHEAAEARCKIPSLSVKKRLD